MNPLIEVHNLGHSLWVDDIRRAWLNDGTLARWISADRICGVTSNPAIFEKTISQGKEYRAAIGALQAADMPPLQICETLMLEDVRKAADLLAPVHHASGGRDGFVSLEVPPTLAHDTAGTVREAQRLWHALERSNVMIKVPATAAGLPAISTLIAAGICVNVTLIFGLRRYAEVVEAFHQGIERRSALQLPVKGVASVASIFISRIDTAVDPVLQNKRGVSGERLKGATAIACAQLAYAAYCRWMREGRWLRLAAAGAQPQRLLWASTSVKDAAYPPLKYVEALIGPGTVDTLPVTTLDAYRQAGHPEVRLQEDPREARAHMLALQELGIDMDEVAAGLEMQGVRAFVEAFERLIDAIRLSRAMPVS